MTLKGQLGVTLTNNGVNGQTIVAASTGAALATVIASVVDDADVLLNWGINDMLTISEADFKTAYGAIISGIHAAHPTARIWLMTPWGRGRDAQSNTMAGWIDDIVAATPEYVFSGPDERVWLKGADDGATMTTDGFHYSAAGQAACAAQWKAIIQP